MNNMSEEKEYISYQKEKTNPYLPFLFAIVLAAGIYLGYLISISSFGKPSIGTKVDESKMEYILDYIDNKYVDTVDIEKLETKAINEMLSELDPHSFYIPSRDLKDINDDMRGNFEGIGVEFRVLEDTILIVNAIANGPSEKVGIMSGDKIISVNDSIVAGKGVSNSDVVKMLKGTKGTKVKVRIYRHGEEIDFTITRGKIPLYSLDIAYMINENTGIIKLSKFSSTTYEEFYDALGKLKSQGLESLILDLRGNGGGYLREAVFIADEFLSGDKLVVYTKGTHFKRQEYKAGRTDGFEKGTVVVLIDESSASASEILSGALQDWDRATIIGRRSFGKGLVQEQFTMADNSALRLTVARYYIPSGRSIQKPYDDKKHYKDELYERYLHGEIFNKDSIHQNDSIKYYTKIKRRIVYGGGGVIPDIFVPLDTIENNLYANRLKRKVPEFIYSIYSNNPDEFKKYKNVDKFISKYTVSEAMFQNFLKYAESKGWKKDLSKIDENKDNIKRFLKAFLAKQLFYNDGYYRIIYKTDPVVEKALETISNN